MIQASFAVIIIIVVVGWLPSYIVVFSIFFCHLNELYTVGLLLRSIHVCVRTDDITHSLSVFSHYKS